MTAPITGPFTRSTYAYGPPNIGGYYPTWTFVYRSSYRQKKPYNLVLPFHSQGARVNSFRCSSGWVYVDVNIGVIYQYYPEFIAAAIAKAYGQLVSDIGDASQWAVNVAEYKQSLSLVTKDLYTILRFGVALRKHNFVEAAKILKVPVPKGLKPVAKAFGDNWLKYHFGIEPLVKDIHAAIDTLQKPMNSKRVKGKATIPSRRLDSGNNGESVRWEVKTSCRMGCTVTVNNPNLYLANQLGLVNPASFAWELIPFSFVVDWFTNVGQFLSQMTDFAGLSVSQAFTTVYQRSTGSANLIPDQPSVFYRVEYGKWAVLRSEGITGPSLHIKPWKGVSPVRAATACALLVQQLKSR